MKKSFNLLDIDNILVSEIYDSYKELFDKYNVKNYRDIDNLINEGIITDKSLIEELELKKQGKGIKLYDLSTECLKIDKETSDILNKLQIKNFFELSVFVGFEHKLVCSNQFLLNALKLAANEVNKKTFNKKQ